MIETKYPTDAFVDAVQATAYIARVDVRYGELALPHRVREHVADGDVVVHLLRGEDDVAVQPARLTSGSKLIGLKWPADVKAGTRVTVMCPRGAAGHDVAVRLPDLPMANVDWPDEDLPAAEPEPVNAEPEPEPAEAPVTDEQLAAITGAAYPAAEGTLPGPAEYNVPTTPLSLAGQLDIPVGPVAVPPPWPGDDDLAAGEVTERLAAVDELAVVAEEQAEVWDAIDESRPSRGRLALAWFHLIAWFASLVEAITARVENVGQDVIDHARVVAKVIVAAVAVAILGGTGVLWLLLEVAR